MAGYTRFMSRVNNLSVMANVGWVINKKADVYRYFFCTSETLDEVFSRLLKRPYLGSNLFPDKAFHKKKLMFKISFSNEMTFGFWDMSDKSFDGACKPLVVGGWMKEWMNPCLQLFHCNNSRQSLW